MAESRDNRDSNFLSPLEEQLIQESEADGDLEQQLLSEKELVAQRLWIAFQDSATAVAHLFRGIGVRDTAIIAIGSFVLCYIYV